MGALFAHAAKAAQEQLGAVYVEADILATAPRLLKSAEQLGFVPVAYLPAFYCRAGSYADVVKLVKLNLPYSLDTAEFTTHAKSVVRIIDRNFEDQKLGRAIINLSGTSPCLAGWGMASCEKWRGFSSKDCTARRICFPPRAIPAARPTSSCAEKSTSNSNATPRRWPN